MKGSRTHMLPKKEKENTNITSSELNVTKTHTMMLGFRDQLSSGKGEVQQFCYRTPACWNYWSSLPLNWNLLTDHLVLLHSTRLPTSIFKSTSTSTTPFPWHHWLSASSSFPPAPGFLLNLLDSLLNSNQNNAISTGRWEQTSDHTFLIPMCTAIHICIACI